MLIIEGIAFCFWLLFICTLCVADGPESMVVFYEQDVQERVVELGLTTKERIRKKSRIVITALFLPMLIGVPYMVYFINGVRGSREAAIQMCVILLIGGLFDRIFIDWYWVGHTRAWHIEGTEDLMPYIPKKTMIGKWAGTLIGFPLLAVLLALIMSVFVK